MRYRYAIVAIALALCSGGVWVASGGLSSAQVEQPELIIYWEGDFTGPSLRITGTLLDMPVELNRAGEEYSWNDVIASVVVVRGTWRLYQHGRCNTAIDDTPLAELDLAQKADSEGWSCLVSGNSSGEVSYPGKNCVFAPNDISSIELVSPDNLPDWANLRVADSRRARP